MLARANNGRETLRGRHRVSMIELLYVGEPCLGAPRVCDWTWTCFFFDLPLPVCLLGHPSNFDSLFLHPKFFLDFVFFSDLPPSSFFKVFSGLCLFSDLRLCSCIESSIFFQSLFHDSAVLLSDPKTTPRLFLYFHNCLLSNLKSFDGFLFESSPPVFRFKKETTCSSLA